MKHCPQCNRTYTDDALSFCLDDGAPLPSTPSAFDSSATVQYPAPRDTTPQPTIAYRPGSPPPPSPPPAWSPAPIPQPQKRSVWPWLLGIAAVGVFLGIGVVILAAVWISISNDNSNNRNSNSTNSRSANRGTTTNSNSNQSNTNTNPPTSSTFTDDFSERKWTVGSSEYGNIWYQDDEYHMHATKDGYVVIYAPDTKEYYTEGATVRVTARSVDGNSPRLGYGVVVHGAKGKVDGKLEDFGFLIFNGSNPQYKVVEHKAGAETKLVDWTPSTAIRTGTSTNQLEVRINGRRLDFYINGQFMTTVNDAENYKNGRVGFYTGDVGEVAFDDLVISK
jgi:hypothetical protein